MGNYNEPDTDVLVLTLMAAFPTPTSNKAALTGSFVGLQQEQALQARLWKLRQGSNTDPVSIWTSALTAAKNSKFCEQITSEGVRKIDSHVF